MNTFDLKGKTAVITGGAGGIGAAIANRFLASGAKVAIWDLNIDNWQKEIDNASNEVAKAYSVDVCDRDSINQALNETKNSFGRVDILVTSAGIAGPTASLWEYPPELWKKVQDVNVNGVFNCCSAIVPGMLENNYGRIINIASVAGKEGNPNASAYSTSKAAVIGLTKSLGKELAGHNIAVNCITPAAAKTAILDQVTQEFRDYMLSKIPRARFLELDEIASMVSWLASAENSFSTGAVFDISGGRATY